jgi:hypothetical protein
MGTLNHPPGKLERAETGKVQFFSGRKIVFQSSFMPMTPVLPLRRVHESEVQSALRPSGIVEVRVDDENFHLLHLNPLISQADVKSRQQ